ncbi:DUF2807 domain-containing protein [Kordiimonas sp. SCSIO 12603]|uniref:head GIN domain-containing protein n=1 Tax=Kordiimonas sp. SCSIO 12603 TaxID=2829596 RepID=UPI0021078B44|nr:head GIN domain-containing protein [Kordiimonas sp. SCSIO 12603]UTW59433.1 DUF2807 domain-containing protein [Kordiimonas sp. SCSIO 12603]
MKFIKSAAVVAALSAVSLTAMARDVAEQSRNVGSFTEVTLKGSMDAEITVGKERSVRVIADGDIIDRVITEVRGDTLYLEMEKGSYRNIKKLEVIITVPKLEAAGIYGSGDMSIENAKADSFELDLKGSGDAVLSGAEFGDFTIDLAGSGDINVEGSCSDLKLDLRGSGDVSARRMECESADVDLRGSGDISFYASKQAGVSVRGSGDVDVYGQPSNVRSNVRGSGDVNIR